MDIAKFRILMVSSNSKCGDMEVIFVDLYIGFMGLCFMGTVALAIIHDILEGLF